MGTKNNPGAFDCYAAARPDEPMFVLLGRDDASPLTIGFWNAVKACDRDALVDVLVEAERVIQAREAAGRKIGLDKSLEALQCADGMERWKKENPDV